MENDRLTVYSMSDEDREKSQSECLPRLFERITAESTVKTAELAFWILEDEQIIKSELLFRLMLHQSNCSLHVLA